MRRLDNLIGKVERFILQYGDYLSAKLFIGKYNLESKKYKLTITPKILEELKDAQLAISLWEKGVTR
jgi:hypothetical protein